MKRERKVCIKSTDEVVIEMNKKWSFVAISREIVAIMVCFWLF
jgi:hypothetical protein